MNYPKNIHDQVVYKQTKEPDEFRYFEPLWFKEMAKGLTAGAVKYPGETWKQIPSREHVFRAMRHLNEYLLKGDEEDIIHASMRCMFAFSGLHLLDNKKE